MRWINKVETCDFDIVPLFETMDGMTACENIMDTLFLNPVYRSHVNSRKDKQTIMLGFSDGTKDGGYLKANWSIFKSKEVLTSICKKHNVSAIFFDGRGGPPARGGGKTHEFYAALGSGISNDEIQITIQGQTITSTYGTKEKFKFNSELLISAGIMDWIHKADDDLCAEDRSLIEELSEISYKKYTELKAHPNFLGYLERMTTLKYYSEAHIGSRPAKRKSDAKLTLSDLRAISYVGSWSQLKQNIPGYFGIGTAISTLKAQGRIDEIKLLYQRAPFFKTLIENSMMSMTKCFFELTSYMKANEEFKEFWIYLYNEFLLSRQSILEITGYETLMENDRFRKESILMREKIILPLLIIQNYALQKVQTNAEENKIDIYKKLVLRSLYGNINASRNSA
jgi:phosphoenolpyruvate carboxylase